MIALNVAAAKLDRMARKAAARAEKETNIVIPESPDFRERCLKAAQDLKQKKGSAR